MNFLKSNKIKKIIAFIIVGLMLGFILIYGFFDYFKAQKNGFKNLREKSANIVAERTINKEKKIFICTNPASYSNKDNPFNDYLKEEGFYVVYSESDKISLLNKTGYEYAIDMPMHFKLLDASNCVDFLSIQFLDTDNKAAIVNSFEDYLSGISPKSVFVIGPEIVIDPDFPCEVKISYDEYVKMVECACKKYNIRCINLYKAGFKQKLNKDGNLEPYNNEIYEYIKDEFKIYFEEWKDEVHKSI